MRTLRLAVIMFVVAVICLAWKALKEPPRDDSFDYDDFLDYKYGRGKYRDTTESK